jgi:hypothetical protein
MKTRRASLHFYACLKVHFGLLMSAVARKPLYDRIFSGTIIRMFRIQVCRAACSRGEI